MTELTIVDWTSFAADAIAIVLGILAVGLAMYFYIAGRRTEKEVSNSLVKIETQAEMLNRVTMRQLDKLTEYATRPRGGSEVENFAKYFDTLKGLAEGGIKVTDGSQEQNAANEANMLRIALRFYVAQTNYWSQAFLPSAGENDPTNDFEQYTKRIVDLSHADFGVVTSWMGSPTQGEIDTTGLRHLYVETNTRLVPEVRSVSDIYEQRAKAGDQ